MPEGPEIYKASVFINTVCKNRLFTGKIKKSTVNWKNPEIPFSAKCYMITSKSRGKELKVYLQEVDDCTGNGKRYFDEGADTVNGVSDHPSNCEDEKSNVFFDMKESGNITEAKDTSKNNMISILFQFGMSGKFMLTEKDKLHKHAHLMFYSTDDPPMVLSFVDVRRFGKWEITDKWSENRSPDPLMEYKAFRENVLKNLQDSAFNKPICELLNNQKYFNGIGNYLRAEIIFRAGIPPFEQARKVLEPLLIKAEEKAAPDILELCHVVPNEVIKLPGAGYDPEGNHSDYTAFMAWLQCYYNPVMNNLIDGSGRTIWFKGNAGPQAPKVRRSRNISKSRKRKQEIAEKEGEKVGDREIKKRQKSSEKSIVKSVTEEANSSRKHNRTQKKREVNTELIAKRKSRGVVTKKNEKKRKVSSTNSVSTKDKAAEPKKKQKSRNKTRMKTCTRGKKQSSQQKTKDTTAKESKGNVRCK